MTKKVLINIDNGNLFEIFDAIQNHKETHELPEHADLTFEKTKKNFHKRSYDKNISMLRTSFRFAVKSGESYNELNDSMSDESLIDQISSLCG